MPPAPKPPPAAPDDPVDLIRRLGVVLTRGVLSTIATRIVIFGLGGSAVIYAPGALRNNAEITVALNRVAVERERDIADVRALNERVVAAVERLSERLRVVENRIQTHHDRLQWAEDGIVDTRARAGMPPLPARHAAPPIIR